VFVVALAELGTSVENETPLLAADLATTVYEARLRLAAGLPCVVLSTPDRERALEMLGKLRGRGHGAVAFDARAVVSASSMVTVRRYRWAEDALELDREGAAPSGPDRLLYTEMSVLLRAMHRSSHERRRDVKEVQLRPGAAIATGGLIMTKTVHKQVRKAVEAREQVLYLFRRGGTPWLLRENASQSAALGDAMHPTRALNFAASVQRLRERAPEAPYDERLLAVKRLPEVPAQPGKSEDDRATAGVDLLAHVLALWLSRTRVGKTGASTP
jgi:hypothetical protein